MDARLSLIKDAYVYRHTKLGTSEVFYIGIGNQPKYSRAYTKKSRSVFWNTIVTKYNYEVEILAHNLTWEQACELETILISYYKRRDCCGGTLVNMTDGGDGARGVIISEEQRKQKSISNSGENNYWFGKKLSKEHKDKIRESNTDNMIGEKHPRSRLVLDTQTGVFFMCLREASQAYNIKYTTLKAMMQGVNRNKTNLIYV